MNNMSKPIDYPLSRGLKRFYYLVIFVLAFSGFGQMPIFKRYYLADLPGMAWSADFYVTLVIHYVAAALLLAMLTYYLVSRAMAKTLWPLPNKQAWVRGLLFALIIATGTILILRNLPGLTLPPALTVVATISHVAGAMLFLIAAATYLRFGKKAPKR